MKRKEKSFPLVAFGLAIISSNTIHHFYPILFNYHDIHIFQIFSHKEYNNRITFSIDNIWWVDPIFLILDVSIMIDNLVLFINKRDPYRPEKAWSNSGLISKENYISSDGWYMLLNWHFLSLCNPLSMCFDCYY